MTFCALSSAKGMDIKMTKKELALEYHKKGYNCTQAVACAFCGEFGVSEEEMYKIAEGFGLGMGMMEDRKSVV